MKNLIAIAFVALSFGLKAQTVAKVAGNTGVTITNDGMVQVNGQNKAQITNNGSIKNTANVVIGSISEDGTIKNASNQVVGYFMSNYAVHDAAHAPIGQLLSTLEVKNNANVKLGNYNEQVNPAWTAFAYFFLKLN